jgi:DNA-binding NarL/FixJ family response regulator
MPEISGIQLADKITDLNKQARVLVMTSSTDEKILTDFLDSGATGLLHKSAHRIELVDAATKVATGEPFMGKQFSRMMKQEYLKLSRSKQPEKKITRREREVLELLVEGLTSGEIAERLYISPRTVDKHRNNMLKKLGQNNTAGLVRYAMENLRLTS